MVVLTDEILIDLIGRNLNSHSSLAYAGVR